MKETILVKHTIVHTLNYIVIELMRRAYQLAMMDELKSLDGLVDTRLDKWMRSDDDGELISIDDDLELLSEVEDPGVKIVVESIHRILEANRTFQMIQNIDIEESLMDTEATEEAAGVLSTYILELDAPDSYKNVLSDLIACYTSVSIILYHCVMQLDLGKTDVWEEGMKSWCSTSSDDGSDYEPKDGSGRLLLDLNEELGRDSTRFRE